MSDVRALRSEGEEGKRIRGLVFSRPVKQLQQRFHKAGRGAEAQRKNGMIGMNGMIRMNAFGMDGFAG